MGAVRRTLHRQGPTWSLETTTFVAALRIDRIDAPWLIDGPIDGESFRTYVERVLVPTLRAGNIVVMDNLGSHKGKAVREMIRATGAKLFFLPKYSPDLNPIEQVFAKLKHLLRKANARTSMPSARQSARASAPSRPKSAPTTQELRLCANLNSSRSSPEGRRFEDDVFIKQLQCGRHILPAFCSRQSLREFEHSIAIMLSAISVRRFTAIFGW